MISMKRTKKLFALAVLLLASALAQDTPDTSPPTPTYPVQLPDGRSIQISAPETTPHPDMGWVSWSLLESRTSPNKRFTAMLFLRDALHAKDYTAETHLVKPDGSFLNLKLGDVYSLHWTADSQYLIGEGRNILRLWNTAGKLRIKEFAAGLDAVGVAGNVVCVALYDPHKTKTVQVERFHAPYLTPIGRFSLSHVPKSHEEFCK